jgi:UDP-GlcNAc:undecaprenyl-phosphate/decaprenyl-phosphate GlcNAc-1-phosphate transferase
MISTFVTMAFPVDSSTFSLPLWILIILGFSIAFTVVCLGIPIIVKGAVFKGLYADINGRNSHEKPIPALGGIAVFAGFILSTSVIAGAYFTFELSYLITSLIVIFIVGLKDDLMGGKPWKKLLGQILSVLIICMLANIRISSLRGFLGIWDIPYILGLILTVFVMITIINGYNLIDGIDGLAAGIGIMISFILGIWFFITKNTACAVMCSAIAGALIAFFYFNVFSIKNKIFLGDTGSLTIGLVLGLLMVRFLQLEPTTRGITSINAAPAFAVSLFIMPFFDTLRVFSIRIMQHKSPFKADRQHIHHLLVELDFSHVKSTIILLSVNLAFIVICYILQDLGNIILIGIQFVLASLFSYLLLIKVKKNRKKIKYLI